jgi:hypothetical protein
MQEIQVNEITKLTPTKTNVLVVANEMIEPILNGEVDAIEFSVRCQFAINVLTEAMKIAKDSSKLDVKSVVLGATVEVVETGTKYDYSSNEIWKSIEAELAPILARKKDIEDKIKMATKINSDILQGDEIIASPVTKESTTSIKITLAK